MRHVFFASVVICLTGSGFVFAQDSASGEQSPAENAPIEPPENLPARPRPVKQPVFPLKLFSPAASAPLAPTAAPSPPLFDDAALDGFSTRWWIGADYILWWTKGDRLPALVTSGSPTNLVPGALGQPGTHVLFGGDYDNHVRSGIRVRGGYWFTPAQTFGIDGTFFYLGGQSAGFDDSSNGVPVLARPFYNVNSGHEDAFPVAYPGRQGGSIRAALSTRLWGADANLRGMLFRGAYYQVNLLGGFRFLDLHDSLGLQEESTLWPQIWQSTATTATVDHFNTSNQFYGGQLGTDIMWCRGRFYIDVLAKVGLGVSVEHAGINGWTGFNNSAGQIGVFNVGQLALPSNIGHYGQDHFAVVPEFGINFGYALTRHIRLMFGYTFLYWSNVFRAGNQIDRGINPTELTALAGQGPLIGPARPDFTFHSTDFWAQGLNFGLQFRY